MQTEEGIVQVESTRAPLPGQEPVQHTFSPATVQSHAFKKTVRSAHRPFHPFPARMAPDIAFEALSDLPVGSVVLDPMCGSGTVLFQALQHGHRAIGFDIDPLAVLISRVGTRHLDPDQLLKAADRVIDAALKKGGENLELPWIDNDRETREFIEFWFGDEQRRFLRCIAWLVAHQRGPVRDALRLAISKIIVTKEPCASRARDTSHSRPHRVLTASNYDVMQGFRRSVAQVAHGMGQSASRGTAVVQRVDARRLPARLNGQVDMVVTSPPYGNAIDYLRGHRLSLVWLGYTIPYLRAIRSRTVGFGGESRTETDDAVSLGLALRLGSLDQVDTGTRYRLLRFARDMRMVLRQIHDALRPGGRVVLVVGNSSVKDVFLDNTCMIAAAAEQTQLREVARYSRQIPANHRYLPPPQPESGRPLGKRMREEVIMTFEKLA